MNEDILIVKIFAACFIAVVLTVGSCISYERYINNRSVVEMVKAGSNPLAAKCAVSPSDSVCSTIAARQ